MVTNGEVRGCCSTRARGEVYGREPSEPRERREEGRKRREGEEEGMRMKDGEEAAEIRLTLDLVAVTPPRDLNANTPLQFKKKGTFRPNLVTSSFHFALLASSGRVRLRASGCVRVTPYYTRPARELDNQNSI